MLELVLKEVQEVSNTALVKTKFYRMTSLFVDEWVKQLSMMNAIQIYYEELPITLLEKPVSIKLSSCS